MIAVLAPFFWGAVVLFLLAVYVRLSFHQAADWVREDGVPAWLALLLAFAGMAALAFVIGLVLKLVGTLFMGIVL